MPFHKLISLAIAASTLIGSASGVLADGGGPTSLTTTPGALTVTGAAPGTFTATLTGADQTVGTSLAAFTASDFTGNGSGWNVTFQADQFTCTYNASTNPKCPQSGGDTFPLGSLTMAPPTVAPAAGTVNAGRSAVPSLPLVGDTAIDTATAVKVADAAANTGMGSYNFTPGTSGADVKSLHLVIPATVYAATYASTLTVSVVSGP